MMVRKKKEHCSAESHFFPSRVCGVCVAFVHTFLHVRAFAHIFYFCHIRSPWRGGTICGSTKASRLGPSPLLWTRCFLIGALGPSSSPTTRLSSLQQI